MDDVKYKICQLEQFRRFEGTCKRCGECCGSQDDPCANLAKDISDGKYYCKIYKNRLGPQKTRSGSIFNCIPIREIIKMGVLRQNCAYREVL
jgi:hypothetical protein